MKLPDVDIDVKDRGACLAAAPSVRASLARGGSLAPHPSGVYYQEAPVDPLTGLCSYPCDKSADYAAAAGLWKVDLIPNHAYDRVRSPEHLDDLLARPVDWSLFLRRDVVVKLQQLGRHFDVVDAYEPKSIDDLACLIAIIRPGKAHLLGQPWDVVRREIWLKDPDGGYSYKKSHAVAFATCIIAQLQSMIESGEINNQES